MKTRRRQGPPSFPSTWAGAGPGLRKTALLSPSSCAGVSSLAGVSQTSEAAAGATSLDAMAYYALSEPLLSSGRSWSLCTYGKMWALLSFHL